MPSRTDRNFANSRVRRHSGEVVLSKKRSKKDKETDTESVTTSSSADTLVAEPKCPFRFMLRGVLDTPIEDKNQARGCPLRRVQLWHTIPLCLLAIINLLIIIVALLGLASYRLVMTTQAIIVKFAKSHLEPSTEGVTDSASRSKVSMGKQWWGLIKNRANSKHIPSPKDPGKFGLLAKELNIFWPPMAVCVLADMVVESMRRASNAVGNHWNSTSTLFGTHFLYSMHDNTPNHQEWQADWAGTEKVHKAGFMHPLRCYSNSAGILFFRRRR